MKIKLYIEGGGDSSLQDSEFRSGWAAFFQNAGLQGKMPSVIRGGGRTQTYDSFCTAVRMRKPNELPLLLVDSEDPVAPNHEPWQHLKVRDGWDKPAGAADEDAFLMVTCMVTWLIADREALQKFFHDCWRDNALPQWPTLESIDRKRAFNALIQATAACEKKSYAKGRVSFDLLKAINPQKVAAACPSAGRLLDRLRSL